MSEIGTTTKTISYAINSETAKTITFTQTIKPTINPSQPVRLYPDSTVDSLLPNVDYVYSFSVNEADGVLDDGGTTNQVNAAANYGGTTVTIPVPAGFVLDTSRTNDLNAITSDSKTQITQPGGKGGNIVITVAAGGGTGPGSTSNNPYKLAGYYDMAQTASEQTVEASGPATITQTIDTTGKTLTATASGTWTDTLASTDTSITGTATVTTGGNGSVKANEIVINTTTADDPLYLNSFSFKTSSAADLTNANITITIPDGFDATGIKVPIAGATTSSYLPETTLYSYTITLADGTVETGT